MLSPRTERLLKPPSSGLVCVGELLKGLEARAANPTKELLITGELAGFDLDHWLTEYAIIEAVLVATIKKHSDAFVSFAEMQKNAFTKTEAHILATNQGEWSRLQKGVLVAEMELSTALKDEKGLFDRQLGHCQTKLA